MCNKSFGPFEAEFWALMKRQFRTVDQVANVAGVDPQRLYNCGNTNTTHRLTSDEMFACIRAAIDLGYHHFLSLADRIYRNGMGARPTRTLNGDWLDEALQVNKEAGEMLSQIREGRVSRLTHGEKQDAIAHLLSMQSTISTALAELGQV